MSENPSTWHHPPTLIKNQTILQSHNLQEIKSISLPQPKVAFSNHPVKIKMFLSRNMTMRSQLVKSLAARQLSTNPHRIGGMTQVPHHAPRRSNVPSNNADAARTANDPTSILYTNVSSVAEHKTPVTAMPSYQVQESPLDFEASVSLPKNFGAGNILVEVEKGAKSVRITGDDAGIHFTKQFGCGGILDLKQFETRFQDGRFFIHAPKIHYMNGNSSLNGL